MRSTTCRGSNGQYLEEFHSFSSASIAAEDTLERFGRAVAPTQCHKCGYWHLTSTHTRKQCMFCTDSALFLKDLYATREEALRTAEWLRKEKRIQLYPYKC
jgi:hypothetical protein